MTLTPLKNYLVANRKRVALSQREVAFLLGLQTGDTVCRHECFTRDPNLELTLAYEAIYRRSASELFGGLYRKIEQEVAERAASLLRDIERGKPTHRVTRKCQILSEIAGVSLQKR
jgi:hypothetical protein